jgi:GrpB-like predicted nucleotidyltransferase (UPF0157 family)
VKRKIEVVPHNPAWADMFKVEAEKISTVFSPEIVAIEHIGSTAIVGIRAKPIIDILVEVRDIEVVGRFNDEMIQLGYEPRGEFGIPGRRYFSKGTDTMRTHHVHIFQTGNPEIERHLNFRDYLRAHSKDAQAYSHLKEELAQRFSDDPDNYTDAKSEFIREIDRKAIDWMKSGQR